MARIITALCALVLLGLTACSKEPEDTRPGQPVKTRQTAFKEILKVFEPMGTLLRTGQYQADRFAVMATELMQKRDAPWSHFAADTFYPPTKAKAEVWSQAEAFERERLVFFKATDQLLIAANAKQQAEVKQAYTKVYDSCQSCHKQFKNK